ncbi:ArsR/SmtB family transcription factor [Octadecabacter temperatus]|nr:metalloregulator ArsR/SmtB family transcription factor [Octadecabacter temperatus]
MDKSTNQNLDKVFSALSDSTRRAILMKLTNGDVGVMDLAAPFDMSQPAISRHIKVLETAGLVTRHRQGTHRMCRLAPDALGEIEPWLSMIADRYRNKYDRLDVVLEAMTPTIQGDE